jgi:RNA polymerase sigma-70 factor (ECF subfamily)
VTRLVRAERPRLVAAARGAGLRDGEALDAVQDALVTFLGLPEAATLVDRDADGARLLATVVHNAARNARRRHSRAKPHDDQVDALVAVDDTRARVARAEQRLAMSACVASLGEGAQRVVMMRLIDELSGDEVAAELGTTSGNVAVMLHRAKDKLRDCLEAADVTPGP